MHLMVNCTANFTTAVLSVGKEAQLCIVYLCILQGIAYVFTFMHLPEDFIQSDLQCIQCVGKYSVRSMGTDPMTLQLLVACSTMHIHCYVLYDFYTMLVVIFQC